MRNLGNVCMCGFLLLWEEPGCDLSLIIFLLNYQEIVALYSVGTDDVILDKEDYGIVRTLAEQYIALIKSAQRIGPYYLGTGESISCCRSENGLSTFRSLLSLLFCVYGFFDLHFSWVFVRGHIVLRNRLPDDARWRRRCYGDNARHHALVSEDNHSRQQSRA